MAALSVSLSPVQAAEAPAASANDATQKQVDTGKDAQAKTKASTKASEGVETIVVTAQKRSENIQKVPVAITAISGEDLAARNLNDTESIKYVAPSVKFTNANSNRTEGFSIRGIGTQSFAEGLEQSVATVIDGVVMGRSGQGLGNFTDIERVEVLRGPQGMLFGKNAAAGVISVIGKKPVLGEYSASMHTSYASGNDALVNGVANLPVSKDSALRVLAFGSHRDGYIENVNTGEDLNDANQYGGKVKYLWKPRDDFSLYAIGDWSHTHANCCVWTTRENTPGSYIDTAQSAVGIVPGPKNDKVTLDGPVYSRSTTMGGQVEMNWTPGAYTFTSISSYRKWRQDDAVDADQTSQPYLSQNSGSQRQSQISQELRLTSPVGKFFDYVAGLYYWHQEIEGNNTQEGDSGALSGALTGTRADVTMIDSMKTDSYAAFGQGTIHVSENLRLIAGARVTRDELSFDFDRTSHGAFTTPIPFPPFAIPIVNTTPYAFKAETSNNNLSWKLGAQYDVTPDVMTYATVSRGYKGPGVGGVLYIAPGDQALVKPEIPTSYEIGVKSLLLDHKLLFNVALFQTTYKDFQTQVFNGTTLLTGSGASSTIVNASSLETKGVEVDATLRPIEGLILNGGVSYVDAYYGDGCTNCGGVGTDTSGKRLPGQSRWTYTVSSMYEQPVFDGVTGFISANWYWRSGTNFANESNPALVSKTYQDGYGILGGSIGLTSDEGDWRVSLFGKNLLDKRFSALVMGTPVPASGSGYSQFLTPDAYRQVGVTADFSF